MKKITLSQGKTALVDDADYEYLNQWKWFAYKRKGGKTFYAKRSKDAIMMHRIILCLIDPKIFTDHIDHNGLNNQRANLRIATNAENCSNRNSHNNSSSKYLGVCWHKRDNKWRAQIMKNYKKIHIGSFTNEVDAALAYNGKAVELFGQFANLNKIAS